MTPTSYHTVASLVGKSVKNCLPCRRPGFDSWVGKIPWRRNWQPPPVFLPGESHGQKTLAGYSPRGHKELDTTEQLNSIAQSEGRDFSPRCQKVTKRHTHAPLEGGWFQPVLTRFSSKLDTADSEFLRHHSRQHLPVQAA